MVSVQGSVETGHKDMVHDAQMDFFGTRYDAPGSKFQSQTAKFRGITRPRFTTRKKLGILLLLGYKYQAESGVITRLE